MLITKSTPLPTFAKVLSNRDLIVSGRNSVDCPPVPVGAIVEVLAVQSHFTRNYARFCYDGLTCYLPTTDLEELLLGDAEDFSHQTEEGLWLEVLDRLERMETDEAQAELESLQSNVRAAGGGREVFIVFAQSWLSTVRA